MRNDKVGDRGGEVKHLSTTSCSKSEEAIFHTKNRLLAFWLGSHRTDTAHETLQFAARGIVMTHSCGSPLNYQAYEGASARRVIGDREVPPLMMSLPTPEEPGQVSEDGS